MILRVSNRGWVFKNFAHRDALECGMDGGPRITVFKLCFVT